MDPKHWYEQFQALHDDPPTLDAMRAYAGSVEIHDMQFSIDPATGEYTAVAHVTAPPDVVANWVAERVAAGATVTVSRTDE